MQDASLLLTHDLTELRPIDLEPVARGKHLGIEGITQQSPHGRELSGIPYEDQLTLIG